VSALHQDAEQFLTRLLERRGPSGFEHDVQQAWIAYVQPHADRIETDAYGNVWAVLEPADAGNDIPTVMVTGHGDEIGLMVNLIEASGLVRVVPIGGVDPAVLPGRRVVLGGAGEPRLGVIGAVPIHLKDRRKEPKPPKIEELFVDFGFADETEAAEHVRVGEPLTLADTMQHLHGDRVVSRAFDNRVGIFSAAEAFVRAARRKQELRTRLVALSTVQEEIGGAGALTATRSIHPDVAFVVDVTHATDIPGVSEAKHGRVAMGGGPATTHGTSNHRKLIARLTEIAEKHRLPLQYEASSRFTGTDTDQIYKATAGVPSALLSLPCRYMHTPAEVVDLGDLEHLVQLLLETALSIGPDERWQHVTL